MRNKFEIGQEVYYIGFMFEEFGNLKSKKIWKVVAGNCVVGSIKPVNDTVMIYDIHGIDVVEEDVYPTLEEAEEECDRRNQPK